MPLLRQAGEHIDAPAVARFVDRIDSFRKVEDARVRRGTQDAKTALDRAIAEAA